MAVSNKILLVEGKSDEAFYTAICDGAGVFTNIKVAPPRILGGAANNKEGVFRLLPTLLNQLNDGTLARLGVVVDADYVTEHGLGFTRTLLRFEEIVLDYGFQPKRIPAIKGTIFSHHDGLDDIGIWIMPNNRDDGMLENWVKSSVIFEEKDLLRKSIDTIKDIHDPKFKPIHTVKAEIATWLAWQAAPGRGMENSVQQKLLDERSPDYVDFIKWLRHIYI